MKKRLLPGIILAAAMAGVVRAVPTTVQQPIPKSGYVFDMSRRQRKRFEERLERTNRNREAQRENRKARYHKNAEERERYGLIAGLSNHYRNLWARAGYPQDLDTIRAFRWPLHRVTGTPYPRVAA